eukprot:61261-Amphidinium_carterae.1
MDLASGYFHTIQTVLQRAVSAFPQGLRATLSLLWRFVRYGLGWPAPSAAVATARDMAQMAARIDPAEPEAERAHPLEAERDSKLPPDAPWHRARIARIP